MPHLEDRLRSVLAADAGHVMPDPSGLTRIRQTVECEWEARERVATELGIAYGPVAARQILIIAALAARLAGRRVKADFWAATADLLTPDSEKPSAATAEGPTSPDPSASTGDHS